MGDLLNTGRTTKAIKAGENTKKQQLDPIRFEFFLEIMLFVRYVFFLFV